MHIHPHIPGTPESIMGGPDHPQAVASQGSCWHSQHSLLLAFPALPAFFTFHSQVLFYPRVEDKTAN